MVETCARCKKDISIWKAHYRDGKPYCENCKDKEPVKEKIEPKEIKINILVNGKKQEGELIIKLNEEEYESIFLRDNFSSLSYNPIISKSIDEIFYKFKSKGPNMFPIKEKTEIINGKIVNTNIQQESRGTIKFEQNNKTGNLILNINLINSDIVRENREENDKNFKFFVKWVVIILGALILFFIGKLIYSKFFI